MELNVLTPAEAVYWTTRCVMQQGKPISPRGQATSEVRDFTVKIQAPHLIPFSLPGRGLRPFIGAVEALQLVGQVHNPEAVTTGSKAMGKYTDDGLFHGSYGQRVYRQLTLAYENLKGDGNSRQAVLSIFDGNKDYIPSKDTPCTLTIQFMIREGALHMRVSMRSNDVYLGLPYDLFQFSALQMAMADALGCPVGEYTHTVGSMHLYHRDLVKADGLRQPAQPSSDTLHYSPSWGVVGQGIGIISERARRILGGFLPSEWTPPLTDFESYLNQSIRHFNLNGDKG